jgi:hypothetical protein
MAKKKDAVVSELDKETVDALNEEEQKGIKLLNIAENESPKQVVERIMLFVDDILTKNYEDEDLREFSFQLGTIWGKMVEKEYGWNWKDIDFGEGANIFLLSPNEYFCCNPLYFLYKILSGNNAGLDGANDNTVLLLFNMLEGIESQKPAQKYQVIS